jgi:hypothetical protein
VYESGNHVIETELLAGCRVRTWGIGEQRVDIGTIMIRRELESGSRARAVHGEFIPGWFGASSEKPKRGDEGVNERGAISV